MQKTKHYKKASNFVQNSFMRIDIITVLPELLAGPFSASIVKRAQEKGLAKVVLHNLRDYPFIYEHSIIKNFLLKNKIKFIDGLNYLQNKEEKTLWVSVKDTHANEKAHKMIGEYLLRYLKKNIF